VQATTLFLYPSWWIAKNNEKLRHMEAQNLANFPQTEIAMSRIDAILAFDRTEQLARIKTPTLVVGAEDDIVTPAYFSEELARLIPGAEIKIFPRGLDTNLFSATRREPRFWKKYGLQNGNLKLLYVGRISKEKDLDVLTAAFRRLRESNLPVDLALVGDGPYLKELREQFPEVCFTGYLSGVELATAFASADAFLFPSTTDTFGNVVLEALASGLPTVVSDQGGPKELIEEGVTGFITKALDVESFANAARRIVEDSAFRAEASRRAIEAVQHRDWSVAFEKFWAMSLN